MNSRGRSFRGCTTCRRRRVKCDETRPSCSKCKDASLTCSFERNLFFDSNRTSKFRFRQTLFSDIERERMSHELLASISPWHVTAELAKLESLCEDTPEAASISATTGPFGVFKCSAETQEPSQGSPADVDYVDQPCLALDEDFDSFDADFLDTVLNMLPQGSPTSPADEIVEHDAGFARHTEDLRMAEITPEHSPLALSRQTHNSTRHDTFSILGISTDLDGLTFTLPSISSVNLVLTEAIPLLNHYCSVIIASLSPFQHAKTPWHTLFVTLAKNCMASLSLGEQVDHASYCVLYGIMAVSAFSMHGSSKSATSKSQAESYKQKAREHVKMMLRTAYVVPKTAKYKSMLMALLVMVQLSTVNGNQDQIDCYLLEAEKLIRVKGLNRRKTRKVRLLHHCYAFERIVYESLYASNAETDHRKHIQQAIEASGTDVYSADSLSFGLGDWQNLVEEMQRPKDRIVSENDLHLELPGTWHATMYPEIFGVPEHWLLLLSLTVRLARSREAAADAELHQFMRRAKALETCILRFEPPKNGTSLDLLLTAMHQALVIYFYRRIYNLDASILSTKVAAIQACLMQYTSQANDASQGSARLVWPVFIAACEAEQSSYAVFAEWLRQTARRTGLDLFTTTLGNVERIREAKARDQYCTTSWIESLRSIGPSLIAV